MNLNLQIEPEYYFNSIHELVRLAFRGWGVKLNRQENADASLRLVIEDHGQVARFTMEIEDGAGRRSWPEAGSNRIGMGVDSVAADAVPGQRDNQVRKALRSFVYHALCDYAGSRISQYGLLTGMRPVKAAHRLLDRLESPCDLETALKNEYLVDDEKASLLAEIARTSRPFLPLPGKTRKAGQQRISMYIGIPYCPSRCEYCSFPGAVLKDYQLEMPPFLDCLYQEMEALGEWLGQRGVRVDTVYIGGGTPSILGEDDLQMLFQYLHRCFPGAGESEMSVEAGRADTLSESKLQLMKAAGVSRLCINPQSMQDRTLELIGRRHSAEQVEHMVEKARQAGFESINMDLIAGLPGEQQDDYEYSCRRLLRMRPENITVHSLALKKGSPMAINKGLERLEMAGGQVERAVRYFENALREAGYRPYYLYRQKYISDNMENIGYALPGYICRYNVQMIEERQAILGLGGGAASKFVDDEGNLTGAFYNPKDPYFYRRDIERLVKAKVDKLGAIF